MAYAALNQKGEKYYTCLPKLFDVIENAQLQYNWLITGCECNVSNRIEEDCCAQGYCWISGVELTSIVRSNDIQWIWGILAGFEKDIPLSKVLEYPRPDIDRNDIWQAPLTMQHPLSTIEIVAHDSSCTLFFSTDADMVSKFRTGYPLSEDFADYLAK